LIYSAQQVAASFPEGEQKDSYTAAASTLRMPYWDWAMDVESGQNSLPDFFSNSTIEVTTPNGTQTIANPLYSYKFQTAVGKQGLIWYPVSLYFATVLNLMGLESLR
jgi:tyrosinase